ncbi:DUF1285 domain-containing protein [Alphaproteobacteria bacterium]|nr:DUF1285 domain-containing protein [Alphaproteobacteria bacterium]MDA8624721.1 DUF1285 domain-containing protein [Alphaproteobacteria bacterium]MDA8666721.1 DUF1285 domain-containing protein [Alphaproteobacteria bacterium]MDA8780166.1 DUF1285 domain-containing protein [Alphaproteobacteria bacterium]MDA9590601.1 DUF1285 domain-containing protein [Alphaproteobacteria bacterium]
MKIVADAEKAGNPETGERGLPPVHLWEPDYCGDIGMKIARDGQWYYANSPIGRKKLVRLFSTILRHDEDGEHYLVTPVEKIRVEVEDAPFIATLMSVRGAGRAQVLRFETNVGDFTEAGPDHPLRFEIDKKSGEPSPYVHVRARLEGLIARPVFYDLVELAEVHEGQFGVWSHGVFFAISSAEEAGL